MGNPAKTAHAYFRCILRVLRMGKLAGGADALERRLEELEASLASRAIKGRCPHCGSAELEPVETAPSAGGREVVAFRCKACGLPSP